MGKYVRINYYDDGQKAMIEPLMEEGAVVYFYSKTVGEIVHLAGNDDVRDRFTKAMPGKIIYTWPEFLGLRYKSVDAICDYHSQKKEEAK